MQHEFAKRSAVEPFLISLGFADRSGTYREILQLAENPETVIRAPHEPQTVKISSGLYRIEGKAVMVDVVQSKIWSAEALKRGVAISYGQQATVEKMKDFEAMIRELIAE